ncbi:MAG: hypothetical protein IPQ07_18970 [Myxococcales bacterium]|nr:hypothetical protein [Myxococcales bacterium]
MPVQPTAALQVAGSELQVAAFADGWGRKAFLSGSVPIGSKPTVPFGQIVVDPAPPVVSLFTKLCWPW